MKIDCIADLHGYLPKLEGGDLLIIAGDLTQRDQMLEYKAFYDWLKKQQYTKKIVVGGNHDNLLEQSLSTTQAKEMGFFELQDELEGYEYLKDSGITFEGLKIWGTPWTNWFRGISPKCKAFMGNEEIMFKKWKLIPDDTDILISHGPPFGVLDKTYEGNRVGCKSLSDRLLKLKLKLHVFGHIHESYGQIYQAYNTKTWNDTNPVTIGHLSVNCSLMNQYYQPINKPIRVELS